MSNDNENDTFLGRKNSYGYWKAGDAVLLGSSYPLCAETVATRPAARVQGAAVSGSSHCKKPYLSPWPTSNTALPREAAGHSPAFYPLV